MPQELSVNRLFVTERDRTEGRLAHEILTLMNLPLPPIQVDSTPLSPTLYSTTTALIVGEVRSTGSIPSRHMRILQIKDPAARKEEISRRQITLPDLSWIYEVDHLVILRARAEAEFDEITRAGLKDALCNLIGMQNPDHPKKPKSRFSERMTLREAKKLERRRDLFA
jgi:hypothetical protein